jgi:arginine/lysine/ornithine decarboxylase
MDQEKTPVLDAIEQYRREGNYTFALPGHRLGLGIDDRTAAGTRLDPVDPLVNTRCPAR